MVRSCRRRGPPPCSPAPTSPPSCRHVPEGGRVRQPDGPVGPQARRLDEGRRRRGADPAEEARAGRGALVRRRLLGLPPARGRGGAGDGARPRPPGGALRHPRHRRALRRRLAAAGGGARPLRGARPPQPRPVRQVRLRHHRGLRPARLQRTAQRVPQARRWHAARRRALHAVPCPPPRPPGTAAHRQLPRQGHLPRSLLPRPPQRRVRGAAPAAAGGAGDRVPRALPLPREGLLLRRWRRRHVARRPGRQPPGRAALREPRARGDPGGRRGARRLLLLRGLALRGRRQVHQQRRQAGGARHHRDPRSLHGADRRRLSGSERI